MTNPDYHETPGDPAVDRSDFDAVFKDLPTHGWLKEDEARLLWDAARSTDGVMVEFGSYHGRSLCLLASVAASSAPPRGVVSVDPHKDPEHGDGGLNLKCLVANLTSRKLLPHVLLEICKAEDWSPGWLGRESVGLVYVDGDHSYEGTSAALRKALECRPQVVAVHDVDDPVQGKKQPIVKACLQVLGPWGHKAGSMAVWDLRPVVHQTHHFRWEKPSERKSGPEPGV